MGVGCERWRMAADYLRKNPSVFEAELADVVPICHTTVAGTRIVGRLSAGYVVSAVLRIGQTG